MANILVVGSMNMDIVTRVQRLPLPGETMHGHRTSFHVGGKGANQACAASRSGARVAMAGGLGSDTFGREIRSALAADRIGTAFLAIKPGATGIAMISIDPAGENSILLSPGTNYEYGEEDAEKLDLTGVDVILLQNEIRDAVNRRVLERAGEAGIPVCMNPAPITGFDRNLLSRISFLIVNELEAEALSGVPIHGAGDAKRAGQELLQEGVPQLIITMGGSGSLYMDRGGAVIVTPAFPVKAVDTTAAGDTFIGAFAATFFSGMALRDSLRYATAASALAVSALGALSSIPDEVTVREFLSQAAL